MSLPFGVALAALFAIVMIRVNVTYWIGRGPAFPIPASVDHWNDPKQPAPKP